MKHLVAPSVNVFVIKDRQVMLSRRANTGWMDGQLCAPGGHVKIGEAPLSAIVREIKEELGVTVEANDLEFLCVAARNASPTEYVAYEFVIRSAAYDFFNAEPEKCSELVWVDLDNLPVDIIPDFREIIDRALIDNQKFLQIGY
jgi:8-oxo-dGTP diphosphatase